MKIILNQLCVFNQKDYSFYIYFKHKKNVSNKSSTKRRPQVRKGFFFFLLIYCCRDRHNKKDDRPCVHLENMQGVWQKEPLPVYKAYQETNQAPSCGIQLWKVKSHCFPLRKSHFSIVIRNDCLSDKSLIVIMVVAVIYSILYYVIIRLNFTFVVALCTSSDSISHSRNPL